MNIVIILVYQQLFDEKGSRHFLKEKALLAFLREYGRIITPEIMEVGNVKYR